MDANQAVFDREAHLYTDQALMPAERLLLDTRRGRWHRTAMLDIGIGTGRTTYTFGAVAGSYLGIDYSPRMIELARGRVATGERVELMVADARDLSAVEDRFDVVLFSYNGIDAVDHQDRAVILSEIARVMKPGGHFLFSAHSLRSLPLPYARQAPAGASRAQAIRQHLVNARDLPKLVRSNRGLDLVAARERGWTIIRDPAHRFQIDVHYIDPEGQVEDLQKVGFDVLGIYDRAGAAVDVRHPGTSPWLEYLCKRTG